MLNEVNWTLELLKVMPSFIIGLIAALIAWQQAQISKEQKRIAQAKLKLDLFVKRLAVYEEVAKLVDAAKNLNDMDAATSAIKQLLKTSHEATFLFGNDVNKLIEELALSVAELGKSIKATVENNGVVPVQTLPQMHSANNFLRTVDIEVVFRPYLELSQW
jgi:hypothetical protein